ncbi:SGNH/GDSL hydrolase family protein [Flexivirga oryzae]|uniref:Lysophospholipase L1-like esterase n=1 Tax=Flexivirga oryzae TaxID=1794944 RepID=A0A839N343_9MICO|nr:SGNH/GDSL hydrolase family protein [Flexivirga oryzae]MBB2890363.1 lysophospholipase L1-like esterase [Flexivirga oryzae]
MRRQLTVAAVAAVAAATVSLPAGAAHAAPASGPQWYLALGDSLAAGYQPTTGDNKTGGYVGGALTLLKRQNPKVKLTNLACSGEDTKTFSDGTKCDDGNAKKSQQARAIKFLKAHAKKQGVVTIDLGANDINHCVSGGSIDLTCLQAGLTDVATNLPTILQKLHAAAPNAKIVVLNYYNPFLAAYLTGPDGQTLAKQSETLATIFNGEIAQAAATIKAPVADIAKAFLSNADTPLVTTPYGKIPTNVARICSWTWMCSMSNIHANDYGYTVMWWALAPYLKA